MTEQTNYTCLTSTSYMRIGRIEDSLLTLHWSGFSTHFHVRGHNFDSNVMNCNEWKEAEVVRQGRPWRSSVEVVHCPWAGMSLPPMSRDPLAIWHVVRVNLPCFIVCFLCLTDVLLIHYLFWMNGHGWIHERVVFLEELRLLPSHSFNRVVFPGWDANGRPCVPVRDARGVRECHYLTWRDEKGVC